MGLFDEGPRVKPLAAILVLAAAAGSRPPVEGDWLTADRSALVRIAPCGRALCGTVVRVLAKGPNVPRTDINNSDAALRSRPLAGLRVLSGFVPDGSGWTGGRAYDPKSGRSYKAKLALARDGSLTVTGCILFLCRSQRWTRPR
jgi:uncharacterized protein (DUF2147 family)